MLELKKKAKENAKKAQVDFAVRTYVLGSNKERDKQIVVLMKDRLAMIEERYANHLEKAAVFQGGEGRPTPIEARRISGTTPILPKAISHTYVRISHWTRRSKSIVKGKSIAY